MRCGRRIFAPRAGRSQPTANHCSVFSMATIAGLSLKFAASQSHSAPRDAAEPRGPVYEDDRPPSRLRGRMAPKLQLGEVFCRLTQVRARCAARKRANYGFWPATTSESCSRSGPGWPTRRFALPAGRARDACSASWRRQAQHPAQSAAGELCGQCVQRRSRRPGGCGGHRFTIWVAALAALSPGLAWPSRAKRP